MKTVRRKPGDMITSGADIKRFQVYIWRDYECYATLRCIRPEGEDRAVFTSLSYPILVLGTGLGARRDVAMLMGVDGSIGFDYEEMIA